MVRPQPKEVSSEMMWSYDYGWTWSWMAAAMVLFWGVVVTLIVLAISSFSGPRETGDQALATLRRRLAAGEISPEDFERTKKVLQGQPTT
jgi:uncharacterized membrane protein